MSKRSNLTTAIYLFIVFLSGILVGAFGHRLYMVNTVLSVNRQPRTPEEYRRRYVEEMTSRLKLSTGQVASLQRIMDETRQRYRAVHETYRPELKTIETEQYQKVRAMLTEPQRGEYERMRAERARRRQQENSSAAPAKR